MKWVKIEKNEDIPMNKQIALGLFVEIIGFKKKIFQIETGYLSDEYNFIDCYGDYITVWDLEDYTHYCIMPETPEIEIFGNIYENHVVSGTEKKSIYKEL